MIKEEFKSLFRNKLLLLVVVAILLIPSIYACLFLASMWDPYGKVSDLPVAVVNEDESVKYKGKKLDVGKKLTDNLRDNDSMAFNIVNSDVAQTGLENGTYYMVITIPKDFSKNASTLMDSKPKKMLLDYKTNPGKNYIAMKMSESAIKEIRKNISEEVTRTYAETVFDSLSDVADGFSDAVDGTDKLINGEEKLVKGNKKITKNLKKLASSTVTFKNGSETLTEGLKTYTDGVSQVDNGMNTLNNGVSKLSGSAVSGSKKLAEGSKTLQSSLKDYTAGVKTASKGSKKLTDNNSTLNNALGIVSTGVKSLKSGSKQLLAGLDKMKTSLDSSLTDENVASMKTAASSLITLNENMQKLNTAVNGDGKDNTGIDMSDLTSSLTSVGGNVKNTATHVTNAGADVKQASEKVTEAYKTLATLKATAAKTGSLSETEMSYIDKAMSALYDASGNSAENAAGYMTKAGSELTESGKELTSAGTTLTAVSSGNLGEQVKTLKTSISQLAAGSDKLLEPSAGVITNLLTGMQSVQTALEQTKKKDGKSGLIEGMTAVDNGLASLNTGVSGKSGLKKGVKTYTAGVSTLDKGLKKLSGYNDKINSGTKTLAKGNQTLATGLESGIPELTAGVNKLLSGSSKLVSNNDTLVSGAQKLSDGADKIADGSEKLADGSVTLGDGITSLKKGTKQLSNALEDGEKEIRENDASDATLDMFSSPVETKGKEITNVKNNGHAMAAYMMSVGLWVGCLAFCLMYPLASYKGELKSGMAWWASKAVVIYPIAILMGVIVVTALHLINGFTPTEYLKTMAVASIAAVAFMSIMYYFNILMGKVGSFVMLIFMVAQLAGSAGTYPVELSGKIVETIHKYMPFTYTVDAFRSTISGGQSIQTELTVLIVLALVFSALTIGVFAIRAKRISSNKPTIYDLIEEKGLA